MPEARLERTRAAYREDDRADDSDDITVDDLVESGGRIGIRDRWLFKQLQRMEQ